MNSLLSLCMIVRDEEKVLRRCLESVQDLVDEMIIVDTGSIDRTKEIALEFTDKIYDFTWINDFSAAKNEAISKATSKWVLVLDADEYLDIEEHSKIINYLSQKDNTKPQGFTLPIYNLTDRAGSNNIIESDAVRIISNHPDIYFERPIHEQVKYKNGELPLQDVNFIIFHTGYTSDIIKNKDKRNRNLSIFNEMKLIKKFEEYDYFTLANEYEALGDIKKALYYYQRADTKKSRKMTFYVYCKYKIVTSLIQLGHFKEALKINDECIQLWPQYIDFLHIKAEFINQLGLFEDAIILFEQCIRQAEEKSTHKVNFWVISPDLAALSYSRLSEIYIAKQNYSKAVTSLIKLIELKHKELTNLTTLIHLLLLTDEVPVVISFLDNLYTENTISSLPLLFQASLFIGNSTLASHFFSKCSALNIKINSIYLIHYAFVTYDETLFRNELPNVPKQIQPDEIDYLNKLIGLGICLWKDNNLLLHLISTENNTNIMNTFNHLINNPSSEFLALNKADIQSVSNLLIDLYKSEYFDVYDWLIQQFPEQQDTFANLLGDYYYSNQQLNLAFDYYSMLIQKDKLDASGYANIGQYYLNTGNVFEAVEVFSKSIDLNPLVLKTYIKLFECSPSGTLKRNYIDQFLNFFPGYASTPITQKLFMK
ncbi:hypothetical protein BVG16_20175 [Paenibacillus selenitireducens]|uniref:Glycosyltransferase 2-like domain-containing protein n=1 Tax=Paenibacillus selenitireducens TaxID=1324314 RepID=A0A1T2X754_9BACL|nr:glycosyltransferase family 2 protein [Paenibacillus selenitireducens]OPA75655.1 hypothetical protein BVG16_20175 [Paenibacillus selenitireducens]